VNPDAGSDVMNSTDGGEPVTGAAVLGGLPEGVLRDGEEFRGRGRCWAALTRERVPLLLLARRSYDLVLTDRRLLLLARTRHQRKRLGLAPDGLALEHDLDALHLVRSRAGVPLLQLLVRVPNGRTLVLEFDPARRALGRDVARFLAPA
jgi:hypothetical protein